MVPTFKTHVYSERLLEDSLSIFSGTKALIKIESRGTWVEFLPQLLGNEEASLLSELWITLHRGLFNPIATLEFEHLKVKGENPLQTHKNPFFPSVVLREFFLSVLLNIPGIVLSKIRCSIPGRKTRSCLTLPACYSEWRAFGQHFMVKTFRLLETINQRYRNVPWVMCLIALNTGLKKQRALYIGKLPWQRGMYSLEGIFRKTLKCNHGCLKSLRNAHSSQFFSPNIK